MTRRATRQKFAAARDRVVRVAIYLRVSTAKQVEGYGLDVQDEACRDIIKLKLTNLGYKIVIVDTYVDEGVSGKKSSRPEFDRLNQDIADKKIDVVVFAKVDRIGRTMEDIHRWVGDTASMGVRIVTADSRLDSQDENFKIMLSLFAWMADMEHIFILERTSDGRERKLASGGWAFGVAPYGFSLEGKGENAVPVANPKEVEVIEKAIALILDMELGETKAAEKLNDDGMLNRQGGAWTGANLRRMLMRNALLGYIAIRDLEANGSRSEALVDEDGRFVHGDTYRVPLPQVVPIERVKAVRAVLTKHTWKRSGPGRDYLLTGRLFGLCGKHYIGYENKQRTERAVSYRCTGAIKNHKNYVGCTCSAIPGPEIEELVWEHIVEGLRDREHLTSLADRWLGRIPLLAETYRKRIEELEEQLSKRRLVKRKKLAIITAQIAADDDFDEETAAELMAEMKSSLQDQEDRLQEELDMNRRWLFQAEAQESRVAEIMALADQMNPKLGGLTLQQKRDVMELFDLRVTVTAPAPRSTVVATGMDRWFAEHDRLVPGVITDEQWERLEDLFPEPTNAAAKARWVSRRTILDALFYKTRYGLAWPEIPEAVYSVPESLKQFATRWLRDGTWEQVIDALGDYEGSPLPSRVTLPDLHIEMAFDQVGTDEAVITPSAFGEQASWILFAEVPSRDNQLRAA